MPTLAAAALFALLLWLGFWQLDRAREKEALHAAFLARSAASPVDLLAAAGDAEEIVWRRARLHGRYDREATYLLDNQVHGGQAGYLVYNAFILDGDERRVLVSRGWVPAGADRARAPAIEIPAGERLLEGLAKPVPVTPVLRETPAEPLAPGVLRVQQIDTAAFGAARGWELSSYEVRLDGSAAGFVRDWPVPGSGRERHLGYAFQWFAMAAALFTIFVVLGFRRSPAA